MALQDRAYGVAREGRLAGEELEGDDAERVQIGEVSGTGLDRLGDNLRRHVEGRANDALLTRDIEFWQHEAKVHEHDALVRREDDVSRLEVAVRDSRAMHGHEPLS